MPFPKNGWQRLWVVLAALWTLLLAFLIWWNWPSDEHMAAAAADGIVVERVQVGPVVMVWLLPPAFLYGLGWATA